MKHLSFLTLLVSFFLFSCGSQKSANNGNSLKFATEVNPDYLKAANKNLLVTKVQCTLSDGTKSECYQIVTNSTPTDHAMGPWCPTSISQGADAGGIWLEGGKVYDVDGEFVKNMASFYKDANWKMYDAEGNINVTNTEQDCINAANPNVGEEYKNFCVECLPSYITDVSKTFLIPVKPSFQEEVINFMGAGVGRTDRGEKPSGRKPQKDDSKKKGPKPDRRESGVPSTRGIALNGVEFSAPAPVNNILSAYTLAPFDDAGGHINVHQGYHYHAATGVSYSVKQEDGHAPLIGYAIDGHAIYANLDESGKLPEGLDSCRGHDDDLRGYHYHVDAAGTNNFINCIHGAYAN